MRVALLLSRDAAAGLALARNWAAAGDEIAAVLLDGASAAARTGHRDAAAVAEAAGAGVAVSALDESLRRRGISAAELVDGVKRVDLDELADLIAEGADKAVWL